MAKVDNIIVDLKSKVIITFQTEGVPVYGEESKETTTTAPEVAQEIAPEDGYFQIELTLNINRGERLTYNNVITYTILGSPTRMLMLLIYDEDSVSGSRVVLVNLDKIESVDAPYAPDTLDNVLKYTETP